MAMDPHPAPQAGAPPQAAAQPAAAAARVLHLFRAEHRAGRIHPLQHLLQRYRETDPARQDGRA